MMFNIKKCEEHAMPFFTLTNPPGKTLALQIKRSFSIFSDKISDWKLKFDPEKNDLFVWIETPQQAVAQSIARQINDAQVANVIVAPLKSNNLIWVVRCNKIDIQKLFLQNSVSIKHPTVEKLKSLLSLIEGQITEIKSQEKNAMAPLKIQAYKINHSEKKSFHQQGRLRETMIIHLQDYHALLSAIKINNFSQSEEQIGKGALSPAVLTFIFKSGERSYYISCDNELTNNIFLLKNEALTLNAVEFSISKSLVTRVNSLVKPLDFWSKTAWDDPEGGGLYYDRINDPLIIEAFVHEVLAHVQQFSEFEPFRVVDLGAGKGRLALKIIGLLHELNIPYEYTLLEPNTNQIGLARTLIEKIYGKVNPHVIYLNTKMDRLDMANQAHCIISSGGPLNINIVSRAEALTNIQKINTMLLPDGVVIATGFTPLIIKAKHFSDFRSISYAVSCEDAVPADVKNDLFIRMIARDTSAFSYCTHFQRYVLKKPKMEYSRGESDDSLKEAGEDNLRSLTNTSRL